jgi:hypothetical protein
MMAWDRSYSRATTIAASTGEGRAGEHAGQPRASEQQALGASFRTRADQRVVGGRRRAAGLLLRMPNA